MVKPNIQDSWNSVERTIDYYGDHQDVIIANAGPGHWNDPDMVSAAIYLSSLHRPHITYIITAAVRRPPGLLFTANLQFKLETQSSQSSFRLNP